MCKTALLLFCLVIVQGGLGQGASCNHQSKTAKNIWRVARRAKREIENFKDDFVNEVLGMEWDRAAALLPPGSVEDECLPPPLPNHVSYSAKDFGEELVRMYALMQGYSIALGHLTLDRVLSGNQKHPYFMSEVDSVVQLVELLMKHLSNGISCLHLKPNNEQTEKLMSKVYTDVGADRHKRDFAILRDTLDALTHCVEVFHAFKAS